MTGEIYNGTDSTVTVSYSIVQGGYSGTSNLDVDPLLAPLGDYGGMVQILALLPGSPAIDAASTNCPATDARGVVRSSPACDLSAFESQGFTLTKTSGDNQSSPPDANFLQPLCAKVTSNNSMEPLDGGKMTFTPPTTGPSAFLTGSPAIIVQGVGCITARANGVEGSYSVTGSAAGAASVSFSLKNVSSVMIYLPIVLSK